MSDVGNAGGDGDIAVPTHGEGELTVAEAARSLTDWRRKQNAAAGREAAAPQDTSQDEAPKTPATPAQPSEGETPDDATPSETEAPGEDQEEVEPAKEPPIEPPRSWTAEAKARWQSLPRETQEYIASREQERDRTVRSSQNEAAETRKAIEAERMQLQQAKQQYVGAHQQLVQIMQQELMGGEFADIRTLADVERLSKEDWPRYSRLDFAQKKVASAFQEMQAAQQRQQQEFAAQWQSYAKKQDELVYEMLPELLDATFARTAADRAVKTLKNVGFTDADMTRSYNGEEAISIRDHRLQLIVHKASLWDEAQEKAAKPVAKPLPPVQRPGTAQPAGSGLDAQIKALDKQFANATGTAAIRLAARLQGLERQRAERRR